jgi:hypothetical protein
MSLGQTNGTALTTFWDMDVPGPGKKDVMAPAGYQAPVPSLEFLDLQ